MKFLNKKMFISIFEIIEKIFKQKIDENCREFVILIHSMHVNKKSGKICCISSNYSLLIYDKIISKIPSRMGSIALIKLPHARVSTYSRQKGKKF